MDKPLIDSAEAVTLIGAGDCAPGDLADALRHAPRLVAADGGAQAALAAGHMPEAVIGDFDSVPQGVLAHIPEARQHRVEEQDSTDFEKCLARIRAPLVVAVGFLGLRVDHQLAAMSALVSHEKAPVVLVGREDVIFHAAAPLSLSPGIGTRLSLFPLAPVTGRSEGLEWPIEGIDFAPHGRIGTSNRVVAPVRLSFDGPGMLVILPRSGLEDAIRALGGGAGFP